MVKEFAITAQIYNNFDDHKQTLLVCESISADSYSHARKTFEDKFGVDHTIVRIFSVEEIDAINQV